MSRISKYFREQKSTLLRFFVIAIALFLLAWVIDSLFWRGVSFVVVVLMMVGLRNVTSSTSEDVGVLKDKVARMASGDLQLMGTAEGTENPVAREFSTSLVLLNARLRQMVEKLKSLSESVGSASGQIVELSHTLLKSGQNQSQSAEKVARAIAEMSSAIARTAHEAESMNELGLAASSASLELTASIEEVLRNSQQVTEFARDAQASMEGMVKGMSAIQKDSEMLVQSSIDMDNSVHNMQLRTGIVTKRAAEADHLAEQAALEAKSGADLVADLQAGMENIAETVRNAGSVVDALSQRSEQIGDILNVITQIADQTNLLSLNAAILSAQAGVHGKGFAVVAEEIRKLSTRTASSVNEIEQLISKIRVEIRDAVQLMDAGNVRLADGLERSRRASDALTRILESASLAREKVAAIAESSKEQILAEKDVSRSTTTTRGRLNQIAQTIQEQSRLNREVNTKAHRTIELLQSVERAMEEQTKGAKEVSNTVERVSEIIRNTHDVIAEQSVTSAQVVQSVGTLRSSVQSSIATIRSLNSTALSLDQESFILKHELGRFSLPRPKSGGTLNMGLTVRVTNLDPSYAQYVYLVDWVYNFYEGLVEYGEGTDVRPMLAEKWDISDDALMYTFRLKRGVRFHNGKELTAVDVKASYERVLHPNAKTPGTWVFEMVAGAEEFNAGKARDVAGITIVDPYTLKIRLTQPVPFFLGMIAQCYAFVMPAEMAARHTPLTEVCGTGPFRLVRFVSEQLIEMVRFDKYHGAPLPYVDRVIARMSMQEDEIAAELRKGKIHLSAELQKQRLSEFLADADWRSRVETNVQLYTSFLAIDCRLKPFQDVRVRQAVAYAIDRERLLRDVVGSERAVIAKSLLPPGLPGYDANSIGYQYDPGRAQSLLSQAGVARGTRIDLMQTEATANKAMINVIQEDLKAVGIDLAVQYVSPEVNDRLIHEGRIPIRLTRWVADYPDPDNFLHVTFNAKSTVFNLGFQNEEFDRLTSEARYLADIRERVRLYQRAERIWMQQCPCVVLFHNRALILHQEGVQGCVPHFTQPVLRLKKVWLSESQ